MSDATELEQEIAELETDLAGARADSESWHHQSDERDKTISELEGWLKKAQAEIAKLTDQIKRSGLIEVDGCRAESDGCSGIVLRKAGKILVPSDQEAQVEQHTKDLQKMANMAREIARLTECVKAADVVRDDITTVIGEGGIWDAYDAARKQVKI